MSAALDALEKARREQLAAYEALAEEAEETLAGSMAYVRPVASDALAVHPKQVNEAREDAVRKGVPTDFRRDGRPLIRSRQHLKEYCKAYGFYNRDAGYGDAQPGQSRAAGLPAPDYSKDY